MVLVFCCLGSLFVIHVEPRVRWVNILIICVDSVSIRESEICLNSLLNLFYLIFQTKRSNMDQIAATTSTHIRKKNPWNENRPQIDLIELSLRAQAFRINTSPCLRNATWFFAPIIRICSRRRESTPERVIGRHELQGYRSLWWNEAQANRARHGWERSCDVIRVNTVWRH